jgi:hypothetical protein
MYTIMICEYNLQPDLCCLDHRAVEWLIPNRPWGFGTGEYRYPGICSNIPIILLEEYNVYMQEDQMVLYTCPKHPRMTDDRATGSGT